MASKVEVPDRDARYARNQQREKQVQRAQAARQDEMANRPVVNPSTNPLPSLANAPMVPSFPAVKK